jgi:threonine/homoserine/homoserine lactone efflux protein
MMPDISTGDLFARAFVLGILFCAPPGPMFAETLHRGLRGGFVPACAGLIAFALALAGNLLRA